MDQSILDKSFYIQTILEDLMNTNENKELEYKSAKGGFPGSFWESYSAFANTEGGIIIFGIAEKKGIFSANPLTEEEVEKLKKEFFNCQNNRQKVSTPLLTDNDIKKIPFDDGYILCFIVPRATRQQRPVYIGADPMTGTYRRNNEGDYHSDSAAVSQMFAERDTSIGKVESRVLNNYTWDDIDMNSFRQYRTLFSYLNPTHPWVMLDDLGLMRKLGGYRKDRQTGKEGFTMAGVLMFGKQEAITDPECAPGFMVDYREIPDDTSVVRWVDRIYPDGTWEANLFQFYRLVLPKLNMFLPKPFRISGDTRIDDGPAQIAVREAFINMIVHAQYGGSIRITVCKTSNGIVMSNPGTLLVSTSQYYEGGKSESRNPALQTMFGLIGKSDKAGSGVDKIMKGWKEANWRRPYIEEIGKPDKVDLFLPMEALIDDSVTAELKRLYGKGIENIDHNQISVLAAALEDGEISNISLQSILAMHPSDITKLLHKMCKRGFLVSSGFGRGTTYSLNTSSDSTSSNTSSDSTSSDSTSSDSTSSNTSSDSISSDDVCSDDVCSDDVCSDDVCSDDVCSDDVCSDDVCSDDVCSDDVSSDSTSSDSTSSDSTSSDSTSSDSTSSDSTSSDSTSSDSTSSDSTSSDKEGYASTMILSLCKTNWYSSREISRRIGRESSYTRRIIARLVAEGLLMPEYTNLKHPAQRYRTVNDDEN